MAKSCSDSSQVRQDQPELNWEVRFALFCGRKAQANVRFNTTIEPPFNVRTFGGPYRIARAMPSARYGRRQQKHAGPAIRIAWVISVTFNEKCLGLLNIFKF